MVIFISLREGISVTCPEVQNFLSNKSGTSTFTNFVSCKKKKVLTMYVNSMTKYPDKINSKTERLFFIHKYRERSTMTGKAGCQKPRLMVTHTVRKSE